MLMKRLAEIHSITYFTITLRKAFPSCKYHHVDFTPPPRNSSFRRLQSFYPRDTDPTTNSYSVYVVLWQAQILPGEQLLERGKDPSYAPKKPKTRRSIS